MPMDTRQAEAIAEALFDQPRAQAQRMRSPGSPARNWGLMLVFMWLGYFGGQLVGRWLFDNGAVTGAIGLFLGGLVPAWSTWRERRRIAAD